MNASKEDLLLAAGIAVASAAVGAGIAYFMKKRNKAPSARQLRKIATPQAPIELDNAQRSALSKFTSLFVSIGNTIDFDANWASADGTMINALKNTLANGAYATKDAAGRRLVILVSEPGTSHIAYQRWAGDVSTIEVYTASNGSANTIASTVDAMTDRLADIINGVKVVNGDVEPAAKAA